MQELTLKIKSITIVRVGAIDTVYFSPELPTPFPEMQYPASFKVDVRAGYAEEWLARLRLKVDETIVSPNRY